jgi:hypothetical protein
MGLTIHYSLKAGASDARARKLIHTLHQSAQDLPFKELGQIVELSGERCDFNKRDEEDPLHWLLIQATGSVELKHSHRMGHGEWRDSSITVLPACVIAFTAWPGEGCEQSNFGLCKYPAVIETSGGPLKTRLSGWRWSSFCKTQYASDPNCGGVPNFLQCHLSVIALLDKAKELGCLAEVHDEGGFWEQRDLQALVQQIGSWNERIAALGGKLKDLTEGSPLELESAISRYPDFEQLEAAGQDKLLPGYEKLARLIGRVGREVPAT